MNEPVTLHKNAYGNLDPVNTVDPSGNFGLVEFGASSNIREILSSVQMDVGFSLADLAFNQNSDGPSYTSAGASILLTVLPTKYIKQITKLCKFKVCKKFLNFTKSERNVISEVQAMRKSGVEDKILKALKDGVPTKIRYKNRLIEVEPGAPVSGMTLSSFGENGFIVGKEALKYPGELTKTLLQEVYRLEHSRSIGRAVGQAAATTETQAAFGFSERAFTEIFK